MDVRRVDSLPLVRVWKHASVVNRLCLALRSETGVEGIRAFPVGYLKERVWKWDVGRLRSQRAEGCGRTSGSSWARPRAKAGVWESEPNGCGRASARSVREPKRKASRTGVEAMDAVLQQPWMLNCQGDEGVEDPQTGLPSRRLSPELGVEDARRCVCIGRPGRCGV